MPRNSAPCFLLAYVACVATQLAAVLPPVPLVAGEVAAVLPEVARVALQLMATRTGMIT